MNQYDSAFEIATSNIRFGPGTTGEVGGDLAELGIRRALVLVDPHVAQLEPWDRLRQSLVAEHIDFEMFSEIHCEPTQRSFQKAIDLAQSGRFDGFVALGGGSTIDTAKVANLFSTYPAEFLTYVNAPLGVGQPVPGPLKPLIAIPTTAGTGSETTGVAICDLDGRHLKTGIAHRRLKPTLGILDPDNTRSVPVQVAASAGLDVLCHAIESYTAIPYDRRPAVARASQRPNYQGANPVSDIWVERAIAMTVEFLPRVWQDPTDDEARAQMLLAAAYAGIGFGNAGVHLPHALSYPIASQVRSFRAPGYPEDHPLVPHGISVVLTAPAVFRLTAAACPERHRRAAELLGADPHDIDHANAGQALAERLTELLRFFELPNGLQGVGYDADDIAKLAAAGIQQQRLIKVSPVPVTTDDLEHLLRESLTLW